MYRILNRIFFTVLLICVCFLGESGFSKSDINEPVRVLLSNSGFSHNYISVISKTPYYIMVDSQLILTPIGETTLTNNNRMITIKNEVGSVSIPADKKIILQPAKEDILTFLSIKKNGANAKYKGKFEITGTQDSKLRLINIIQLEDYLKGVVPNEMPVNFGLEALKAQAIAARGYVFRENLSKNFDVYDSVSSQVYKGENSRTPISDKAVETTKGQFAIYDNKIILSLYSSTAGGMSENYENVFSVKTGSTSKFPSYSIPYLKGVSDIKTNLDLSKDEDAETFYLECPQSFDINSPLYRWEYAWKIEELEEILSKNLIKYKSEFIRPELKNVKDFGKIKNIEVLKRGVSGKAMYVKITTTKNTFYIAKEIIIRKVFEYNQKWLPSANIIFKPIKTTHNKLEGYSVFGGGYGHGVGMSQFGAGYMAQKGFSYKDILKHYYTGISIATFPVSCENKKFSECKTSFYTTSKKADLVVISPIKTPLLTFNINGEKLQVKASHNSRFDIEKYLKIGLNEIKLEELNNDLFGFSTINNLKFYIEFGDKNE